MLTKGRIKLIESLKDKKSRIDKKLFVVQGEKSVAELLHSDFEITDIFGTKDFFGKYRLEITNKRLRFETVEAGELQKIGSLETNDSALAVVRQKSVENSVPKNSLILALCDVRDPGNLGTIMRIADWYGIQDIVASKTTCDIYNPKAINASMGSFLRVTVHYVDLEDFFRQAKLPVFGALMKGKNIHEIDFPKDGILLIGNESNGIPTPLLSLISEKITIPRFGEAESLNAGVAAAIILDNWRRNS